MTRQESDGFPVIDAPGPEPLMAMSCNGCRTVRFCRSPKLAVKRTLEHAAECGSNDVLIAEIVRLEASPIATG